MHVVKKLWNKLFKKEAYIKIPISKGFVYEIKITPDATGDTTLKIKNVGGGGGGA